MVAASRDCGGRSRETDERHIGHQGLGAVANVGTITLSELALSSRSPALHIALLEERAAVSSSRRDGHGAAAKCDGRQIGHHCAGTIAHVLRPVQPQCSVAVVSPALDLSRDEESTGVSTTRRDGRGGAAEHDRGERSHALAVAVAVAPARAAVGAKLAMLTPSPAENVAIILRQDARVLLPGRNCGRSITGCDHDSLQGADAL